MTVLSLASHWYLEVSQATMKHKNYIETAIRFYGPIDAFSLISFRSRLARWQCFFVVVKNELDMLSLG